MPAHGLVKKAATYADLLRVPEPMVAEILDGDLHATPRPAFRHANAASVLGAEVLTAFQRGRGGPGGWWILDEPELHLAADVVVPDLAGWQRTRLPTVPDVPWLELSPDWACEVISASTEAIDRGKKLAIYAREGVPYVWLINPTSQTLEVLTLRNGQWTMTATYAGRSAVRALPFEAIELDLSALWID
jgi:Uma2 family endonuclease